MVSFPLQPAGYVTRFASYEALEMIEWDKLTFDERVVLHRVARQEGTPQNILRACA
jgi:hypothetical protein